MNTKIDFNRLVPELDVRNFTESLAFYTEVLGFEVLFDRKERGFAYLTKEGAQLMLAEIRPPFRWKTGEYDFPLGRGVNLQIEVSDVRLLFKNVERAGVKVFQAIKEEWYRCNEKEVGNLQFLIQDPDGYLLRFFQDLGERSGSTAEWYLD